MEYNLVEMWLRWDPRRLIAGILAGLLASAVSMSVGMLISSLVGVDIWFPVKLIGAILIGPVATTIDSPSGIYSGAILCSGVCSFLGLVFAHFTGTNSLKALLPMGVVWGIFSWIFIWNLFMQSFHPIYAAKIPSGAAFPVCIAFGVALASVSFFDCLLHGKKKA